MCELKLDYVCGIGFHGDTERRKVVCVRLGASFHFTVSIDSYTAGCRPVGEPFSLSLHHGDMYVTDEKAAGLHWRRRRSVLALRHAVGVPKRLAVKRKSTSCLSATVVEGWCPHRHDRSCGAERAV